MFNAQIGPWTVNAFWPEHQLVVEINGHAALVIAGTAAALAVQKR